MATSPELTLRELPDPLAPSVKFRMRDLVLEWTFRGSRAGWQPTHPDRWNPHASRTALFEDLLLYPYEESPRG